MMFNSRALIVLALLSVAVYAGAQGGGQLHFCLHSEPKTFDPVLVEDDASERVRYVTGGFLLRLNRLTQELEPEVATSWKLSKDGRTISFQLREGLHFSDGTPFSAADVAFTMQRMMDPSLHSATGDAFRSGEGKVQTQITGPNKISVTFAAPVASLDRKFDQVAILSAKSPKKEMAVLGPFYVADYKAGASLLLNRNPNYWKHDEHGRQLPYLDSIRLDIQQNRDTEMLRFLRGEIDLVDTVDAEYFNRAQSEQTGSAHDAGVSLDPEQLWFNQTANSPIPAYKRAWFRSTNFRVAVWEAINRDDMARLVYRGRAQAAVGMLSPADKFWFNTSLRTRPYDPQGALKLLAQDGFQLQNGQLRDRDGHMVEFSVVTGAGNKTRERMATMMQEDLSKIGIMLNVVTLDFPSLIERITHTFDYEACLLGLTNMTLGPDAQMNVWLSSAENHQWNPSQKQPETAWEAEIDRLMRAQASSLDPKKRKDAFDRVQQIAWEQAPFIYLVNRHALSAVSPKLYNVQPAVLQPYVYWNIDRIAKNSEAASK
jgi:peptide/nickel transport system substrate-binding protein